MPLPDRKMGSGTSTTQLLSSFLLPYKSGNSS